ncbi:MAG: DUF6754 domain-containing protein [Chloroflexia bacterium]
MRLNFGGATLPALVLLLLAGTLLLGLSLLETRRRRLAVGGRPVRALEGLRSALRRAAEAGETVHISPGAGTLIPGGRAAETLAGLEVAGGVAEEAFSLGIPVVASTNDALVHIATSRLLESAREKAGAPVELEARCLWLSQQDRMAYAVGTLEVLSWPEVQSSVLVGSFDTEMLLLLDAGSRETRFQLPGAASAAGVPFLPIAGREYLLGEEIYVAGACLQPRPGRLAGVATQDFIRLVVMFLIVAGVLLVSLRGPVELPRSLFWMPFP